MPSAIEEARAAYAVQSWRQALSKFDEAAAEGSLGIGDYESWAVSAHLVGEDDRCASALEAGHLAAVDAGDVTAAARCAFWLAFHLMMKGKMAQAGGWLARTEAVVSEAGIDCVVSGYLLIPKLLGALGAGDTASAQQLAAQAIEVASRFQEPELRTFGTLGHGQALLAAGDTDGATRRFDEAMVSVTAGEVGPVVRGIVYCAVILECVQLYDFERAAEWTEALSRWCDSQPDLVPFRGQCLVHRSQVQQAAGDWPRAAASAEAACVHLNEPPHPALGLANYQEAELYRLRGQFDEAEASYRKASRHGHAPMPGLALLELARGRAEAAASSVVGALAEPGHPAQRPGLLVAAVEILRAAGDNAAARAAAEELAERAAASGSPALKAMAAQAMGSVLSSEGDMNAAGQALGEALRIWQGLRMPYETARASVLLGLTCAATRDQTSAELHFANAREIFEELGAAPDLERLRSLTAGLVGPVESRTGPAGVDSLSAREAEVLVHVATGLTNREIAEALVISQHTVGRHLENIFTKLGVSTRAAATAWAYEHHLVGERSRA